MFNLKNSFQIYLANSDIQNLLILFLNLITYCHEYVGEPPKINIKEMYELSYDLDNNDLRLAYRELEEYPTIDSVGNMILVILMLCKGFGLTYDDFKHKLEKILQNKT